MKGLLMTPENALAVMREVNPKKETRRVVPGEMRQYEEGWSLNGRAPRLLPGDWCQYQPGETVCMLTTWAVAKKYDRVKPSRLPAKAILSFWHAGMTRRKPLCNVPPLGKSRPGRFLPNKLRHLMPPLLILDVDMQRVREITEAGARAEGCIAITGHELNRNGSSRVIDLPARLNFRSLWNRINAKRGFSWQKNPRVFVIKFNRA